MVACIRNAVVVVVDVIHVHQAIIVVISVGRVWGAVIVVVWVDEVGDTIAIQIAIDNRVKGLVPRMPQGLSLHVVDTADEVRVYVGSGSRGGYGDGPGHRRVKRAGVVVGPSGGEGEAPCGA